MPEVKLVDYGPLQRLIGIWKGHKGLDVVPEPEGKEENPYHECMVFEGVGNVSNAESQCLAALQYRQIVCRNSDNKAFHDQSGYWMWDAQTGGIMHAFSIPRGVSVLAGGNFQPLEDGGMQFRVSARIDDADWGILQSPFMLKQAKTTAFSQRIDVTDDCLSYQQSTMLDIYGRVFEHTDHNILLRQEA